MFLPNSATVYSECKLISLTANGKESSRGYAGWKSPASSGFPKGPTQMSEAFVEWA
jgi:hypothetical protein